MLRCGFKLHFMTYDMPNVEILYVIKIETETWTVVLQGVLLNILILCVVLTNEM